MLFKPSVCESEERNKLAYREQLEQLVSVDELKGCKVVDELVEVSFFFFWGVFTLISCNIKNHQFRFVDKLLISKCPSFLKWWHGFLLQCCNGVLYSCSLGLHELDALNDQEVKDFRSKMFRISEERMQQIQMMAFSEWVQACYSPQLEPAAVTAITAGVNDAPVDLKVIIHFDQSQVRVCNAEQCSVA